MPEERAHCATDDFRVPEVNGVGHGQGGVHAEGCRGAEQRADVARVLHAVEDQHACRIAECELRRITLRNVRDDQNPLRRLGGRCTREIMLVHLEHRHAGRAQGLEQRGAARRAREC
jgi:hypothetical protein